MAVLFSLYFLLDQGHANEEITVQDAWIREAPPTVKLLAAYMSIINNTEHDLTMISADSPAFESIMFHRTVIKDGVASMRHADQIVIPAHSRFDFAPGAYHMMLMGGKQPLKAGDIISITLLFKEIDIIETTAIVRKSAEMENNHQHH